MDLNKNESINNIQLFLKDDLGSELGALAAKIAYYNFEWRFVTLIMFSTVQASGLNTFLRNYQQAVVLKLGRFIPRHRVAVPQVVIFGEDTSELTGNLRWFITSKYDSNAKYIIVCAPQKQDCDERKIFETLHGLYIVNVILLKTSNESKEPIAFSYRLFPNGGVCYNKVPEQVDLFTGCKNGTCFKGLFKEKFLNYHKCRLVVSTVEQPPFMFLHNGTKNASGIDGDIMKLVADMLNANLTLRKPVDDADSGHYTNSNWTGSLGDIFNHRCHVSVCATPLTSNKYGNFQISFAYHSMDIVWATRLPLQKPQWEKLLYPLSFHLRITLLLTFIGIICINLFWQTNMWHKVKKAFEIGNTKYSLLFYSWILFLGLPIVKMPTKKSFILTVFVWIWCCFIIRSAYQAALFNSLKHPAYLDNLKSFRDVLREKYPYGGLATLKEYFYDDRDIYDNWTVIDLEQLYDMLDKILDGSTNFVIAANKELIKHHLMKYNGTKQLQIIPEKLVNSPTVVYFRKFSPMTSAVSYSLRKAFEAGFVHRFFERYLVNDRIHLRRSLTPEREPLRMEHFAGCFGILIVGWFLSATYFVVENICGHLDRNTFFFQHSFKF